MIKCIVIGYLRTTCTSAEMMKGYMLTCGNAEGVHAHLWKCWRGTCLPIGMLKGYMVRKRLGTPGLYFRLRVC